MRTMQVLRSRRAAGDEAEFDRLQARLPAGCASVTVIAGTRWFRNVSANPNADVGRIVEGMTQALAG
jgi:L-2,4-diaminobutyrate decarboxylase